jgi:Mycothiol maleylpyruvate isomerase N-terminal domain/DinB superfamily
MTALGPGPRAGRGVAAPVVDLRRAPLAEVRAVDLRAADRDLWTDEVALWDRMLATWAGLDDAAWHLPGAAPSDAGGPDWSLAEHVGHIADWLELAVVYTARALETGEWPSDDDYDGGDFDRFNEGRRDPWASLPRDTVLGRMVAARPRLLELAERLPAQVVRANPAWGWIYSTLHGHYLDHLAVIEPWTDALRVRQTDGDPFVDDPRPADQAGFAAQDRAIAADFDQVVHGVPFERWTTDELTPGWTLRDHVAHLADWAEEGVRAVGVFERRVHWLADPDEGIDAWNERMVALSRETAPADVLPRYDRARADLLEAVGRLSNDDLRSPDGWSWAYDCLHGHVRKHLAMVGPWCATVDWPAARG